MKVSLVLDVVVVSKRPALYRKWSRMEMALRLSDGERKMLAAMGQKLGKKALQEVATIVRPATILAWHRRLVAQQFDGSTQHQAPGRPKVDPELETLIVRMAQEHRSWGYDRIVGALANLGRSIYRCL